MTDLDKAYVLADLWALAGEETFTPVHVPAYAEQRDLDTEAVVAVVNDSTHWLECGVSPRHPWFHRVFEREKVEDG